MKDEQKTVGEIEVAIDQNSQMAQVMAVLEDMEDEQMALGLLRQLDKKSKMLGALVVNRDKELSHDDWQKQCQEAQNDLDKTLHEILNQ